MKQNGFNISSFHNKTPGKRKKIVHPMQKFVIILTLHAILLLPSCSKMHPYIKINTPTNGQRFNAPEVIKISADLQDSDALGYERLVVTKVNATHDTIINFIGPGFYGNMTYHLIDSFISEPATQYKIVVGGSGHSSYINDSIFVSTY